MPEFPLSLRLIGLRVTKLKDLREDERKGIKRVRLPYLPITARGDKTPLNSKPVLRASRGASELEETPENKRRDVGQGS